MTPCLEDDAASSEDRLVAAAAEGDHTAFTALYNHHLDRIYRHCYWRCGSKTDAEDLTQQTFLKAWSAMPRFRKGGAPFVGWLLAICHNEIVNYFRKCRPSVELDSDSLACMDDPEAAVMDRLALQALAPGDCAAEARATTSNCSTLPGRLHDPSSRCGHTQKRGLR